MNAMINIPHHIQVHNINIHVISIAENVSMTKNSFLYTT